MSRYRIHHPCQHQLAHHHKQGPEHFLRLLVIPKRINRRIHVGKPPASSRVWLKSEAEASHSWKAKHQGS